MATNTSAARTSDRNLDQTSGVLADHPVEIALFNSTGPITFLWLIVRLWLGWQWLEAGWEKLQNPKWMDGTALGGYWNSSINSFGQPHSNVAFDWYINFLKGLVSSHAQTWFAPLVAWGEVLGGIALILGLFTGIAAFLLAFMNFNYMLAGSAGVNPVYFILAFVLVMAWKNAGWWGLDRFILPALGTPWRRGTLFTHSATTEATTPTTVNRPRDAQGQVIETDMTDRTAPPRTS